MLLDNKKVAIVGGGPAGLTLARLLQLEGVDVNVFERDADKNIRQQGATLDLHEESGLEALRRAKLIDQFYAHHRPDAGRLRLMDKHAHIHFDEHADGHSYAQDRPEIDRAPLRNILLESLGTDTVVWDRQFVSLERENEGWLLTFKNGDTVYADLVIGADGANSRIRPYVTNIQPIYSGITIVEGNISNSAVNAPKLYELVKGAKIFAFSDEQSIILSAKGDGSLSFYTGCKVPEHWATGSRIDFKDKGQVLNWFKSAFGSWDEVWFELFASDDVSFMVRPQYHYPLDQYWPVSPVLTILGDAAHRMPPYAGEGVNMAMQDAFQLAECLTGDLFDDLAEAIGFFEDEMQERAADVTQITLQNTEMLHSRDAIPKMLAMMRGEDIA